MTLFDDDTPPAPSLDALKAEAASCTRCDLYKNATQTVFGEGAEAARVMLVGEVPGDKEDLAGRPFVGPAGQLLDRALEAAGIDRDTVYVTNIVKHFKWKPMGKRRLHQTPNAAEVAACKPWLEGEIARIAPELIVCLGATAAKGMLGPSFRVTKERGKVVQYGTSWITATVHPSSILRADEGEPREIAYKLFVDDLKAIAERMGSRPR